MGKIDLLIKNTNVLTLDSNNRKARSIAVTDGRIVGIWSETEPQDKEVTIDSETEVIDLNGATILPGFIDTHNHMLMYGQLRKQIDCRTPPNQKIEDILNSIRRKIGETETGEWIRGWGYDDTLLKEKRHLTRNDLDSITKDNPVLLFHISSHIAVVNSTALKLAGIKEDIANPLGGSYGRDENGRLNGVLYEAAAFMSVAKFIPVPSEDEQLQILGEAAQEYLAQGITTNTDAVAGQAYLDIYIKAANKGINPIRSQVMIPHEVLSKNNVYGDYTSEKLDQEIFERSDGRVRLDSAKLFQDGSIQALTGALREAYHNAKETHGDLIHTQEFLNKEILNLHKRGFRIAIHGNGDRAIGSILDGFAHALENHPRADHRHRIEHVQTATTEDLDRMKELSVAGSFFINHVYYWGDRHQELFLGPERANRINPLADAVGNNLLFTLHSDCPVTPISPLFSVWAAVNRLTSGGMTLGSEQRIDVITALKAMTIYGAKLNFDEQNSGSIEIGKRADFAVLEADPTTVNPVDIKDISVLTTIIDGQTVFCKKGGSSTLS